MDKNNFYAPAVSRVQGLLQISVVAEMIECEDSNKHLVPSSKSRGEVRSHRKNAHASDENDDTVEVQRGSFM